MFKRAVIVALLSLSACGGGGGSSSQGSLRLHFAQNPLAVSVLQWDIQESESDMEVQIPVEASVSGTSNATTHYVLIVDQGATFKPGQATVDQTGSDSYRALLPVQINLPLGLHTGTLQVRVCGDPGCGSLLASAELPYRINVTPNPTLTLTPMPATLVGKALVTGTSDPDVVGFHVPTFTFQGVAQLPAEFRSPIYIRATDADGRIAMKGWATQDYFHMSEIPASGSFPMDFSVTPHPAQGEYTGTITFKVCRDPDCQYEFSGSSSIAYQLSVVTASLTPLAPVAGVPDWQTRFGNAAHTAYVPLTVDLNAFAPRWLSKIAQSDSYNYSTDMVTAAGHVFVTREGEYTSASTDLYAIRESDSSVAWQKSFDGGTLSPMLAANGNVYLQTAVYGSDATLHGLAASSGNPVFARPTASHYVSAPLLALGPNLLIADTIDGPNGYNPHFNRYDGRTGALLGVPSCLQPIEWQPGNEGGYRMRRTPPIQGETAYIFMSSGLEIVDFGAAQSCTNLAYGELWFSTSEAALAPSGNLLYTRSHCSSDVLMNISTSSPSARWSQEIGNCIRNVAVANGIVYAVSWNGLEARDEDTGALLWGWQADGFDIDSGILLVTDNMLFVKSGSVLAIDLTTHKVVWSLSATTQGEMALSPSGVLYLIDRPAFPSTSWSLIAINLR